MLVNNDSINIYDLLGMVAGGGEIVSNGGSGGSDCTHTIRVAHAFSQSSGNWQHYNGSSNDGRTAYVGCAMNILNSLQSSQFSNESAGTSAVSGVSYLSQDDEALPLIPQEFLDLYQPEEIDTVDDDQMESYVDSKLVEVRDDLCSRACCRIWIEVDCPHENVHDACGQSVLYYCF